MLTVAYVVAVGAYVVLTLGPSAAALRSNSSALALQYDSLSVRVDMLEHAFDEIQRLSADGFRSGSDSTRLDSMRDQMTRVAGESAGLQASLVLSGIPPEMRAALAEVASLESDLSGVLLEALQDVRLADYDAARGWVGRAETVRAELTARLHEAQRLGLRDVAERQRELQAKAGRILIAMEAWAAVGLVLAALALLLMHRRLMAPLRGLEAGLARVARGDLDVSLSVTRDDELGRLKAHFNEMTRVLRAQVEVAALRASEVRFRSLIEHGMDLISIVGPAGRFLYTSPAVERILGYGPTELTGRTVFDYVHPDDRAEAEEQFEREVRREGNPIGRIFRMRRKDGAWRVLESVVTNLLDEPMVGGLVVNSRDITERLEAERRLSESEARFRAAFMTGSDAYVIVRRDDGHLVEVNEQFVEMFGYSRGEVVGRTSLELGLWVEPEDRASVLAELARDGYVRNRDVLARRKGGETFPALYSVRNLGADEPALMVGVIRDVSEQRRSAEALRTMEEQFRQAQRLEAVGRLAGGVAHDFNNVLTVITGISQLLLTDLEPGDPTRGNVEEIQKAAQKAATLTRQLLAFSRRQMLQPKVFDLNATVRSLEKMLPRLLGEDVKLEFSLAAELGAVQADPGQIEQVILNLAVNARDAMPGGGRLTIETGNAELDETYAASHAGVSPGPYVLLAVTDSGTGMDRDTLSHVFEPFFTTKAPGKGTGLGLATVHGIVSQSGGSVWAYSEPGHGTTFKVYLPRIDAPVDAPDLSPSGLPAVGGRETLLIVEDDPGVRRVASRVLEERGYDVKVAQDGQAALTLSRAYEGDIDLLVTDLVMPGMPGRELASRLLDERPTLRVLYMSGYTDDVIVRHAVLERGSPYLQKPFTPNTLATKVREALDRA